MIYARVHMPNRLYMLCTMIMYVLLSTTLCGQDFDVVMAPIIERIKSVADYYASHPRSPKPIIAIAGCTAVGKSYFTRQLYQALRQQGVKVIILLQDDFIHPGTALLSESSVKDSYKHPNFHADDLSEVLQQIRAGCEHVKKSAWNKNPPASFTTDATACFWDIDCVLLEGTYVLCGADTYDLLKYSTLRIFLDAAEDDIYAWKREREAAKPGPRSKEKFEKNLAWDMESYRTTIKPTQKDAHFIVHKDSNHLYSLREACC